MTGVLDPLPQPTTDAARLHRSDPAEDLRLAALRRIGAVQAPTAVDFDEISGLAARLFGAPMALISLVDSEREWLKSSTGLDLPEMHGRDHFCASALDSDRVMVVQDATTDVRFRDNPFVIGEPGIRFYAGAPLIASDGYRLGTLCVMDTVPRLPTAAQLQDLSVLSRQIVRVFELRVHAEAFASEAAARTAAEAALTRNQHLLDEVMDNTDVLIYAKNRDGAYLLANSALLRVMVPTGEDMLGRTDDVFPLEMADTHRRNDSEITVNGRRDVFVEELTDLDGVVRTYRSTKFRLRGPDGDIYAVAGVSTDVTELIATRSALEESEASWRSLVESSPVAVALVDDSGAITYANPVALALLGVVGHENLLGPFDLELSPLPGDRETAGDLVAVALGGASVAGRALLRRVDGSLVAVAVSAGRVVDAGRPIVQLVLHDVTTQIEAETALRESEQDLAAIAAVARCVQSGGDVRQVVVESVRSLADASTVTMLELVDDDTLEATAGVGVSVVGRRVGLAEPSVTAHVWRSREPLFLQDAARHPLINPALLAIDPTVSAMWQPVVADGVMVALLNVTWRHSVPGLQDRAVRAVQVIAAEAAASLNAARLRIELEHSAATDPLTGSLNRRAWNARVRHLMDDARTSGESLAIAVLDLDSFKTFNDTFGHTAGDVLLRDWAAAARSCVRESDLFARWGGEEFVVALPNCSAQGVESVLSRLRHSVPSGQTCSVGYTVWDVSESMGDCISRADAALYEAKRSGRNRVVPA